MASQTLIFAVLPNGITGAKTLRLSLYLTPRLDHGATLAAFPDILHWAELVQKHGLKFVLTCGAKSQTVSVDTGILRPDVWQEIFKPDTFVERYQLGDFDKRLIVSYPVRDVLGYLKYAYTAVGSGRVHSREGNRGGLGLVLRDLVFRDGSKSNLAEALSQERLAMWQEQHPSVAGGGILVKAVTAGPPPPPDGVPVSLVQPASTRTAATRFALFHNIPPAPNRPPLPSTAKDFEKVLDFHKALTALNSYPQLLRSLGLVFDVEVPSAFCPNSPDPTGYLDIAVQKVSPGFKFALAPKLGLPSTSYIRDGASFATAPATAPADLTSKAYLPGDVIDGFLALTPDNFHLTEVDVDGAMLKALIVADNVENAQDDSVTGDTLPSLRSGGIGLVASDRGFQLLQAISDNQSFDQALTSGQWPRPFSARDLVRGFRMDVWSSTSRQWYSLHRRNGTYKFGPTGKLVITTNDEEGFLQPAVAQPADDPTRPPDQVATDNHIPQPGTDLFFHERVARWDGWSLSAARPGLTLNRSVDPGEALTPDPTVNQPITPFKMTTAYSAMPGSLPELRFGRQYRVRARAVDLAGNSVPLKAAIPPELAAPAEGTPLPYLRFEPAPHPIVVLLANPQPGGSLDRMVIRSFNSSQDVDTQPVGDIDQRHIAPPKAAERMVEQHGMLDDANGKLRGDAATYNLITSRDRFDILQSGGVPLDPGADLNVGYLPDPIARGAALRNLPNTPDNTSGRTANNKLAYTPLPDVQPRLGSVAYIDFGTDWPGRKAFRIALVEGTGVPRWDGTTRLLTVSLPKSGVTQVELSSFLLERDLDIMGKWNWLRELFEALTYETMHNTSAGFELSYVTDLIALVTRLVLEGGHPMISPSRTLTLVHATQQPLGRPQFVQLPVIHQPADPIYASALRNSFTPITAWRSVGSHNAVLLGALHIHGQSSSKIEIDGQWVEVTDDPSKPAPVKAWQSDKVETFQFTSTDAGLVYFDATQTRAVGVYIPKVDTLWFSSPIDQLDGVTNPGIVAAPVHRFSDTKHRWVNYTAIATSRFQEYFSEGLDFTRSSAPLSVDVPSSSRPASPDIAYVVPTFGWERQETSNVKSSVRFGNGLRVYLHRPWFSSGDSELLGVVLWPSSQSAPDYPTRETFKAFFTQWGNDPVWTAGALSPVPATFTFTGALTTANGLSLEETQLKVDVAGHTVSFDQDRGLWFCDIEMANFSSYAPFVRLALARYQPHSIEGVELSRVVLADYAQLTPDRSAVVSIDPADPRRAKVFIGGLAPDGPIKPAITVTVERRIPNIQTDLGWEVAPNTDVTVTEDAPPPAELSAVLWSGTIVFAKNPPPHQFRVVVREFERIIVDSTAIGIFAGQRLVFAAIIPPPCQYS
jgi:hypothetical protein